MARLLFALLVASTLVAAVVGGLLRAGWLCPSLGDATPVAQAAARHAALMLSAFFGAVISLERAVALKLRWLFAAPLLAAGGGLLLVAGLDATGAASLLLASTALAAAHVVLLRRQRAPHTVLLAIGVLAWWLGNAIFATGSASNLVWWLAFPVLTIAAERLEMTRLMRRHPAAHPSLYTIVVAMVAGAALSSAWPNAGGALFGAALLALAIWLGCFDIARRTALAHGLSRYMAACLLLGYAWLGVGGIAFAATAVGLPARDVALHAIGLGFVFGMVLAHAPVILPAIAGVKLLWTRGFYGPLALLQASLALRLGGAFIDPAWLRIGSALNAFALLAFALAMAGSAIAWRRRFDQRP